MISQETKKLRELAKSWNNLDISFIENEIADNFIYISQWVLLPIKGKREFLTHLNSKFIALKSTMQTEMMSVSAEMAIHPAIQNRPCIVLTQITINGMRQVTILSKIKNNKIRRIDVCFIPDPQTAFLTGEIPK